MRSTWSLLLLLIITATSCSDGDIILTNFDFENVSLETCENGKSRVFFKRKTQSPESMALSLPNTDSLYYKADTLEYRLDGNTTRLFYRMHDDIVTANYFCQSIPPSDPKTLQEYVSDAGTATVYVVIKNSNIEEGKPLDSYPYTLTTEVHVSLNNIVLYNGKETTIIENMSLGTIKNVLKRSITSPDQE